MAVEIGWGYPSKKPKKDKTSRKRKVVKKGVVK